MANTILPNHGLRQPAKKDTDYHVPLNLNFSDIDARLPRGHDGDPNGEVAGVYLGQPIYDYTNKTPYYCTEVGDEDDAVWEPVANEIYKEVRMTWGTVADIPTGWQLCDGTNGVPDLRNKFIVGANADDAGVAKSTITGAALQTGGSTSANTSSAGGHTPTGTISGTAITEDQMPVHDHGVGTLSGGNDNHKHFTFVPTPAEGIGTQTLTASKSPYALASTGSSVPASAYPIQQPFSGNPTPSVGLTSPASGTITISGDTASAGGGSAHTHTFTGEAVAAHNHSVELVPPFYALCFITRIPLA